MAVEAFSDAQAAVGSHSAAKAAAASDKEKRIRIIDLSNWLPSLVFPKAIAMTMLIPEKRGESFKRRSI